MISAEVDEYFHAVVKQFALKFGLAMHWHSTGCVAGEDYRIFVASITNNQPLSEILTPRMYELFSDRHFLKQGSKSSSGRFEFSSGSIPDKSISGHLALMGTTFSAVSFVIAPPEAERLLRTPNPINMDVFHRKQIFQQYPYGLRRLSGAELKFRLFRREQ
jgi:hypothetical protein